MEVSVGALGTVNLFEGAVIYCGSGSETRYKRHIRTSQNDGRETLYWHIDYLLSMEEVSVKYVVHTEQEIECSVGSTFRGPKGLGLLTSLATLT